MNFSCGTWVCNRLPLCKVCWALPSVPVRPGLHASHTGVSHRVIVWFTSSPWGPTLKGRLVTPGQVISYAITGAHHALAAGLETGCLDREARRMSQSPQCQPDRAPSTRKPALLFFPFSVNTFGVDSWDLLVSPFYFERLEAFSILYLSNIFP